MTPCGGQFNSDTGANYDMQYISINNATLTSAALAAQTFFYLGYLAGASAAAGRAGNVVIDILDYASTTLHKVVRAGGGYADATAANSQAFHPMDGEWRNTAAITAIKLAPDAGTNFATGTRATLFGLS